MIPLPTHVKYLPRFTAANKPSFLPSPPAGTYLRYWLNTDEDRITVPAKAYGRHTSEALNVQIPRGTIEHNLVWENVAAPPWQAMQDCMNAINLAAFLGVPQYELLLAGAQAEPTYADQAPLGAAGRWRIRYVFHRCPRAWDYGQYTWNHAWVENYGWTILYEPNSGPPFYRNANFSTLLAEST